MSTETTRSSVDGASVEPPRRAGRNLPAAIAVGAGLGALIIVSLLVYEVLFLAVVAAAIAVGLWELATALGRAGTRTPLLVMVTGSTGMIVGAYVGGPRVLVVAFAATVLVAVGWRMRGGADGFVRDVSASIFCLVYAPFLAAFVALLLASDDGVGRVITFVVVTVSSDIGGYAVGVVLGRHPLAPSISPKKTWEGFAGSAAACAVAGVVCVTTMLDGGWAVGLLLGLVVVVAATLGDLAESLVKRDLGVKDMSTILPGHGGLMDRLDSLLATVSVVWVILTFVL